MDIRCTFYTSTYHGYGTQIATDQVETVNYLKERSKPTLKEYKNRHNWVGKVIQ